MSAVLATGLNGIGRQGDDGIEEAGDSFDKLADNIR
jgi:hypothetical protein